MDMKVSRNDLDGAFSVVRDCTTGQGAMMTAHVLFRPTTSGGYDLLATNSRNFGSVPLVGSVTTGAAVPFTVEAKRLGNWLKAVAADATITFKVDNGKISASTTRGKVVFSSLDPAQFPFWDGRVAECKAAGTIQASRLGNLLRHGKHFISDQEHRMPHLCVAQARDGALFSTDQTAVAVTTSEVLKGCSFRFHFRDIGAIINFIAGVQDDGTVEVLEHDNFCMLRRADGATIAATRFAANFPSLNIGKDSIDQQWWVMDKDELSSAIQYVSASAAWDDKRITLKRVGDRAYLTMKAAAGDPVTADVFVGGFEVGSGAAEDIQFSVSSDHLLKVLAVMGADQVKIGINQRGKAGWLRFREDRDGDDYLTVLTWMA